MLEKSGCTKITFMFAYSPWLSRYITVAKTYGTTYDRCISTDMKNWQFNSLVWGLPMLAPNTTSSHTVASIWVKVVSRRMAAKQPNWRLIRRMTQHPKKGSRV